MIAERTGIRPQDPAETGNSDLLREIARRLEECRDEVNYRVRRAGDCLERAQTRHAENAAWAMSEEADRMENVLAALQEAPLAFWSVYLDKSPFTLLALPEAAVEAYACDEWAASTREEDQHV